MGTASTLLDNYEVTIARMGECKAVAKQVFEAEVFYRHYRGFDKPNRNIQ